MIKEQLKETEAPEAGKKIEELWNKWVTLREEKKKKKKKRKIRKKKNVKGKKH